MLTNHIWTRHYIQNEKKISSKIFGHNCYGNFYKEKIFSYNLIDHIKKKDLKVLVRLFVSFLRHHKYQFKRLLHNCLFILTSDDLDFSSKKCIMKILKGLLKTTSLSYDSNDKNPDETENPDKNRPSRYKKFQQQQIKITKNPRSNIFGVDQNHKKHNNAQRDDNLENSIEEDCDVILQF